MIVADRLEGMSRFSRYDAINGRRGWTGQVGGSECSRLGVESQDVKH